MRHKKSEADVCLLLEGTYPYVMGGVSAWVHQTISRMPDRKFSIVYVGGKKESDPRYAYEIPDNVTQIDEVYLHSTHQKTFLPSLNRSPKRAVVTALDVFRSGGCKDIDTLVQTASLHAARVSAREIWATPQCWAVLEDLHRILCPLGSFRTFSATIWSLVFHMWPLLQAVATAPKAKVYHSVCTGYAGILGWLLSSRNDRNFLLSEHGIYVKERLEDLRDASWLGENETRYAGLRGEDGPLRQLWLDFFLYQATKSYEKSAKIISLFEKNANIQCEFGAPRKKITIIPNGVPAPASLPAKAESVPSGPATVGFLGRVVPIKDVKNLLRAASRLLTNHPETKFLIAGPTDEEPGYFRDCLRLRKNLHLEESVEFIGVANPDEFLSGVDILVMTSVSEGLPFAILEAFANGVPVVTTDVGACREMIEGSANHSVQGSAGIVTDIAAPIKTAEAIATLIENVDYRMQCGRTGFQRVSQDYNEDSVIADYDAIYDELAGSRVASPVKTKTEAATN